MNQNQGRLYLIPNLISESGHEAVIPPQVREIAIRLKHFAVENIKVSRRYLKQLDRSVDIDSMRFYPMGKHSETQDIEEALSALKDGHDLGVISDAGCPGIADPGRDIVALAHRHAVEVIPLTGPSSILLTLIASGLNGQIFSFNGYAPKEKGERKRFIQDLVQRSKQKGSAELLMDTPYRSQQLLEELLEYSPDQAMLCIGKHVTAEDGWVRSKPISAWRKGKPALQKVPVIFALSY